MNPYVYSKRSPRKGHAAAQSQAEAPTIANLVKHIVSAPISTVMAFAVVALAAGSLASITNYASAEIGSGLDIPPISHVSVAKPHWQVLGDSTTVASTPTVSVIDDTALEATDAVATLSVKPGIFDSTSGRFSATITYNVSGGTATISIGNYVVQSGVSGSGSVDTGAILKPNHQYRVTLWTTDSSGAKQILAKTPLKTGKGKGTQGDQGNQQFFPCLASDSDSSSTPPVVSPTPTPASGTSLTAPNVMCLQNKDGKTLCPRPAHCLPMMWNNSNQQGGNMPTGMMGHGGKDDRQYSPGQMGGTMRDQQGQPGQQPQPTPTPTK